MRQRKIRNLDEKLEALAEYTISNPGELKSNWVAFAQGRPLYVEIGCGKGNFLRKHAKAHPERQYVAIEGHESVALHALEKLAEDEAPNAAIILQYVKELADIFDESEIDGLFLNFSDPWPKERHAKRRLTYEKRLKAYVIAMKNGGVIEFKTDNDGLFEYSLQQIQLVPELKIEHVTRDLHAEAGEDLIMTEYEEKFSSAGKNINFVKMRVCK